MPSHVDRTSVIWPDAALMIGLWNRRPLPGPLLRANIFLFAVGCQEVVNNLCRGSTVLSDVFTSYNLRRCICTTVCELGLCTVYSWSTIQQKLNYLATTWLKTKTIVTSTQTASGLWRWSFVQQSNWTQSIGHKIIQIVPSSWIDMY